MPTAMESVKAALAPRYQLGQEIGRGGMATVYSARDTHLGRDVAIKVLRTELSYSRLADRFKLEIAIAAKLNHRHIVALYDWGDVDGILYYVMPLIRGETLRTALERDGRFSLDRAIAIVRDVAEGLEHAHRAGVIHRDIKPENILLADGYAMVADFGVARALQLATEDRLSTAGAVFGTRAYMSPEQAGGESDVNARSDVFSLGCVLYEMLTLAKEFPSWTPEAALLDQLAGRGSGLTRLRPDVPPGVSDVVDRALAADPRGRFPSVAEFMAQLDATARGAPASRAPGWGGWLGWVARRRGRAAGIGVLAALTLVGPFLVQLLRADPASFTGRPSSVVVLPFRDAAADPEETKLAEDVAVDLTRELNGWQSIRAVPRVSLAGPAFDLGMSGPSLTRVEDGLKLARKLLVQALVVISTSRTGDTVSVEASLFDAATGRPVGRPMTSQAAMGGLAELVGPIAKALLELGGSKIDLASLHRQTAFPEALVQESQGRAFLERWRLDDAETHFRRAIAIDSTFAMAFHLLAQTLYWQAAQSPERLGALGPEIARFSGAAVRHSPNLPERDRSHLRAFFSFQAGDYPTARAGYRSLVDRDPNDVTAWLMLGSVEFQDPWLVLVAGDSIPRPRSDLNLAVRAFTETTRLQPRFDLGYGHLFDIFERLAGATDRRGCWGFELPRDDILTPWDPPSPNQQRAFCPVMADSIRWLTEAEFTTTDHARALAGESRMLATRTRLLRRWAAYAPEEAKPRRELAAALMTERSRLGVGDPEAGDSLAGDALVAAAAALALDTDTLPDELYQVAAIHLAAGDAALALRLTERAMNLGSGSPTGAQAPPVFAANIYLALGQPSRAIPLLAAPGRQRFVPDDSTGRLIPYGGAESAIDRIRLLGGAQVGGQPLERELAVVDRLWSSSRYGGRERQLLRRDGALRVAVALIQDPAALTAWDQAAGTSAGTPFWRFLVTSVIDSSVAKRLLPEAAGWEVPELGDVSRSFLLGVVAERVGDPASAVRFLSRLDSIALSTDVLDPGWALRPVSEMIRGRAFEALRARESALGSYQRLVDQWTDADSLTRPLVLEAKAAIARLRPAGN